MRFPAGKRTLSGRITAIPQASAKTCSRSSTVSVPLKSQPITPASTGSSLRFGASLAPTAGRQSPRSTLR